MRAGTFPRRRLTQALALPGARSARPVSVAIHLWRNPEAPDRRRRNILVLGVDPRADVFRHPELTPPRLALLLTPDTVLLDRRSQPQFFGQAIIEGTVTGPDADRTDLALLPVQVVGRFEL